MNFQDKAGKDAVVEQAMREEAKVTKTEATQPPGYAWLRLNRLTWLDEQSKTRVWESAERTTRKGDIDGVAIVARTQGSSVVKPQIILVSQFRPPTEGYVLEMPAGLVDAGETASQAAIRELREECGYVANVVSESRVVYADPGFGNANMKFVFVTVDMDLEQNQNPIHQQEESECIETHLVDLYDLLHVLSNPEKRFGRPFHVNAQLYAMAMGLSLL